MKVKSNYLIYCDESYPLEYEPMSLFGVIDSNYFFYMLYDEKDKYTTCKVNIAKDIINSRKNLKNHNNFKVKQNKSKESKSMQVLDVMMEIVEHKNRDYLKNEKGETKKEIVRYIKNNSPRIFLKQHLFMKLNLIFSGVNQKRLKK